MSEEIGDRSGNRGMCAQPCRLPFTSAYGNGHLFSTKDMCTLMHIPELVDAGIDSFKIEGRMKKKEYSAYLSSLYRHYVDVYESEGFRIKKAGCGKISGGVKTFITAADFVPDTFLRQIRKILCIRKKTGILVRVLVLF